MLENEETVEALAVAKQSAFDVSLFYVDNLNIHAYVSEIVLDFEPKNALVKGIWTALQMKQVVGMDIIPDV